MPKPSTCPTLYDNCLQISIATLKRCQFLKPEHFASGNLTWSSNGNKTGSIGIVINTRTESPYLELNYKANGNPIKYSIQLVSIPSNIGKGVIWFFVCPQTGKRCRKLHLAENYFYHRSAFRGCMYETQTHSHKYRNLHKVFASDEIDKQIYSKHFKTHYGGKPTKRYLRLTKQAERLSKIPLTGLLAKYF